MPKTITINGTDVGLGESADVNLNVARLPTYTSIDLPVRIFRAKKDGPVLLLTGGLHGDEISGIEIVRRMITKELIVPERGTVIALPLVNVYGFIQSARGVPDGKDINRSFPGSGKGSLAMIVANVLMNEILPHIDLGLDFHTGGASRSNYPQMRATLDQSEIIPYCKAFAAPLTLHSKLIDKSFRKAAARKGKPILVYESGEAHRFDEEGIEEGIAGTLRLMRYLGMRSRAPVGHTTEFYGKSMWVRAGYAGLFQTEVELGSSVKKSQLIGKITDPFGYEVFRVLSPREGRVIGLNNSPVVHKGDALMHLAYEKEE